MGTIIDQHYNTDIERSRDAVSTTLSTPLEDRLGISRHNFEVVVKECLSHLTNKLIEELSDALHLEQDLNITPCDMDELKSVLQDKFQYKIEVIEPQRLTIGELINALLDGYKGRFDSAQRPVEMSPN